MPSMLVPFAAGLLLAAIYDVRSRRVPNALVLTFLLLGLIARWFTEGPLSMASGLLGMLVGGAIFFVPFAARLIGPADVKLLAAIGAWLGPKAAFWAGYYGLIAGGAIAIVIICRHSELRRSLRERLLELYLTHRTTFDRGRTRPAEQTVPLALGLAAGGVIAFLQQSGGGPLA